ncbi:MAG: leucine-rich repeat domain-containing protein [Cytophagales bacterium]|nr:leucine-rich repeat domain-containing protein [Cytophagales bacterium]
MTDSDQEKQNIIALLKTKEITNIDLAEQLCKGQNISFNELLEEVFHLSFWEQKAGFNWEKDKTKKEQLIHLLQDNTWELHINDPSIRFIPDSLGYWEGIEFINFEKTAITKLPESIGNLKKLVYLLAGHTKLKDLPQSIDQLNSLLVLDISNTNMTQEKSIQIEKRLPASCISFFSDWN